METVHFKNQAEFTTLVEKMFEAEKNRIESVLPHAEVLHVGSTAIPGTLTKGDVDLQVRVLQTDFQTAVKQLHNFYQLNEGSIKTADFRAFEDDSQALPLGIQLTVIDSEYDFFWKFTQILNENENLRKAYDDLKLKFDGQSMAKYRQAKEAFFAEIQLTSTFKDLKR